MLRSACGKGVSLYKRPHEGLWMSIAPSNTAMLVGLILTLLLLVVYLSHARGRGKWVGLAALLFGAILVLNLVFKPG